MLTYLAPFLNTYDFNFWNVASSDQHHNNEFIENDAMFMPYDRGIVELVSDKLVNVMSYKSNGMMDTT